MNRIVGLVLIAVLCTGGISGADIATTAVTLNQQGVDKYNAGKYEEARRLFDRALRLAPTEQTVRSNLVNCYLQIADGLVASGDYDGAARELDQAIDIQPKNADLYVRSASCYLRSKNLNAAEFNLRAALDLEPDNTNAHVLLGEVLYATGNLYGAIAEWEMVIKVAPDRKDVQNRLDKARREVQVEGNHSVRESRRFVLTYERSEMRTQASRVLRMLDRIWYKVGRDFRYFPKPGVKIPVVLYTPDKFFTATGAGLHIAGLYDGKIRVPIDPKTRDDKTLEMLLTHEYTHVVIRLIANDKVPFWLNEGLAQFESEPFGTRQRVEIERAMRSGKLVPLSQLDVTHLSLKSDGLGLAYAESFAAVRYIHRKFGMRRVLALLNALGEGNSTEQAMSLALRRGYGYQNLEDDTFTEFRSSQ
ncbi:MAG: tetratricopeptide repeat protein [Candidatus Hydrogenedentes bacterium]|nr:tetratricopeptide repeat protein [Candidatus Hydrogenedentota bacterium]